MAALGYVPRVPSSCFGPSCYPADGPLPGCWIIRTPRDRGADSCRRSCLFLCRWIEVLLGVWVPMYSDAARTAPWIAMPRWLHICAAEQAARFPHMLLLVSTARGGVSSAHRSSVDQTRTAISGSSDSSRLAHSWQPCVDKVRHDGRGDRADQAWKKHGHARKGKVIEDPVAISSASALWLAS